MVYCARPEDYIFGLKYLPMAKITAILAMWGLFTALGKAKRTYKDVPKEEETASRPDWRKAFLCRRPPLPSLEGWRHQPHHRFLQGVCGLGSHVPAHHYLRASTEEIIYIQAFSVAVICTISIIKGHDMPRLQGVIGGI